MLATHVVLCTPRMAGTMIRPGLFEGAHRRGSGLLHPGMVGQIAQPYSGPGLHRGPSFDAGDGEPGGVLRHGRQRRPVQVYGSVRAVAAVRPGG